MWIPAPVPVQRVTLKMGTPRIPKACMSEVVRKKPSEMGKRKGERAREVRGEGEAVSKDGEYNLTYKVVQGIEPLPRVSNTKSTVLINLCLSLESLGYPKGVFFQHC